MRTLPIILVISLLALSALAQPVDSLRTDTLEAPPPTPPDTTPRSAEKSPMSIAIEQLLITNMHLRDTIDIMFNSHGQLVAALDLKLGIDDRRVDILEILPGQLYDSCRWEFFNARRAENIQFENRPRQVWQIVAMAQTVPDEIQPLCLSIDGDVSLARLVVSNEHQLETPDGVVPIFFYWEDCSDNSLSDETGNSLIVSRRVYDYSGAPPDSTANAPLFPNRTGVPMQCLNPAVKNPMQRRIDFHNGAIEFRLDVGAPPDTAASDSR